MAAPTTESGAPERGRTSWDAGRRRRPPRSVTMWTDRNTSSGLFGDDVDTGTPGGSDRASRL